MEQLNIPIPEDTQIAIKEINSNIAAWMQLQVTTKEEYTTAAAIYKLVSQNKRGLATVKTSIKRPIREGLKNLDSFFGPTEDNIDQLKESLNKKLLAYNAEVARVALEAQMKLNAQRAKEQARIDRNNAARVERAMAKGNAEKAEAIRDSKATVPVRVVETQAQKITGLHSRTSWAYRITDETKIPRKYMQVNSVLLGQIARSSHNAIEIEGVEFYEQGTMVSKG